MRVNAKMKNKRELNTMRVNAKVNESNVDCHEIENKMK